MSLEISLTVFMSTYFQPAASLITFFSAKVGSRTCGSTCSVESSIILELIKHLKVKGSYGL